MSLKEIKTKTHHCYRNDAGQRHGEYKSYHSDGQLYVNCHFNNGQFHGEYKRYGKGGQLLRHAYYVNGDEVHNFIKDGDSEFIRTCLYMAHGAPWLGDSDD